MEVVRPGHVLSVEYFISGSYTEKEEESSLFRFETGTIEHCGFPGMKEGNCLTVTSAPKHAIALRVLPSSAAQGSLKSGYTVKCGTRQY